MEKKTREVSNSDTHVERKRVRQAERHRVGNRDRERQREAEMGCERDTRDGE